MEDEPDALTDAPVPPDDQAAVDDDRSLAAMAGRVGVPETLSRMPARAGDRLDELAGWWAGVGPGHFPERVARLWPVDVAFEPPEEIADVIAWATDAADQAIDGGAELVALSLPASADPSGPAVLAGHLLGLDAVDAVGFPFAAGLNDLSWMIMVHGVREGLRRMRGPVGSPEASPEDLLARLGDPALAAGCAVVLRCASRRTPLILDGVGAVAAGAFARHLAPAAAQWWTLADAPSSSPVYSRLAESLRQEPLTRLGLHGDPDVPRSNAADGTGAAIALSLLGIALTRAGTRAAAAQAEAEAQTAAALTEDAT